MPVRQGLADLLQRRFLLEVASAVALGWAALAVVQSFVRTFVEFGAFDLSAYGEGFQFGDFGGALSFEVFGHLLDLRGFIASLVTFLLVLAVVLVLLRRVPREQ